MTPTTEQLSYSEARRERRPLPRAISREQRRRRRGGAGTGRRAPLRPADSRGRSCWSPRGGSPRTCRSGTATVSAGKLVLVDMSVAGGIDRVGALHRRRDRARLRATGWASDHRRLSQRPDCARSRSSCQCLGVRAIADGSASSSGTHCCSRARRRRTTTEQSLARRPATTSPPSRSPRSACSTR